MNLHHSINIACLARCPATRRQFEMIPEEDFNRNITSVTPGGRPLGFKFTVLFYEADGKDNPCYTIPDTNEKRVEIMAEPDGGSSSQIW